MKLRHHHQTNQGLTLIEAVIVIGVIAFLLLIMLPPRSGHYAGTRKIHCINNLKQLALAIKVWAGDHNDRYPTAVSVTNGGVMEFVNTPEAWKAFQVISNEIGTPLVLYCPEDPMRNRPATNFTDDLKNQISYFMGVDATDTNANSILSGDDNFLNQGLPVKPGLFELNTNTAFTWDVSRHTSVETHAWIYRKKVGCGNLGLADGSVQSTLNPSLTTYLSQTGLPTNRLVIP